MVLSADSSPKTSFTRYLRSGQSRDHVTGILSAWDRLEHETVNSGRIAIKRFNPKPTGAERDQRRPKLARPLMIEFELTHVRQSTPFVESSVLRFVDSASLGLGSFSIFFHAVTRQSSLGIVARR